MGSNDNNDLIKYHANRAIVFFNMKNWEDALKHIDFVEKNSDIDDALVTLKWKSIIHLQMSKVRDSMKNSIGMKILNNSEQMNLLINISEDKIDELVNKNQKRKSPGNESKIKQMKI